MPVLQVDINSNGLYDPGDTIQWRITIENGISITLREISIVDTLPTQVTYVPNSTFVDNIFTAPGSAFPLATPLPLSDLLRGQQVCVNILFPLSCPR